MNSDSWKSKFDFGTATATTITSFLMEGSLEVKLPTILTHEKQNQEETQTWKKSKRRRTERGKIREEESQKREAAGARKGKKVPKHHVFSLLCGSGGSKSRFAKATGAEPTSQIKSEKWHAVVARSTFGSKKNQNTTCSEHFWK